MDSFERFLAAGAVIFVVGLGNLIGACFAFDADQHHRVDAAKNHAAQICGGPGSAEAYDVQDQSRIVYACREGGSLKTIDYGQHEDYWVFW